MRPSNTALPYPLSRVRERVGVREAGRKSCFSLNSCLRTPIKGLTLFLLHKFSSHTLTPALSRLREREQKMKHTP
ncbi:hypothetical protein MIZ03_1061 [Rhodoferax lithotrophicus]|uniref:Uncharacterized protein n=1 Tax=Rhodoferax lithotrophicus TaxID=2798804 RepID=A0ABM7MIV6_9BURK|nr:hypothetical protein MIZ03_1061 [Rhodoferax sp. MIZ03]